MIYRRQEYIEEAEENAKFPVRHIEVLSPIDNSPPRFIGHVTLGFQTPMGVQQIPVTFEIDAPTIEEAFPKFEQCAEPQIEEARKSIEEEIRKLRQEASSRIIRPGEAGMGGGLADIDRLR